MKIFKSPVFIICCILFIAHKIIHLLIKNEIPFLDAYLDMFLAMPIILTFLLAERIYLFKWKGYTRLTVLEIVMAVLFVALISEIVFPVISDDFTRDWVDVIFLFLGALLFYFTINPRAEKQVER